MGLCGRLQTGAEKVRKDFFFEKKQQKTFGNFRPVAVQTARSKFTKFFLLLFVHKKEDSSSFWPAD
jgi:hypothetical protein